MKITRLRSGISTLLAAGLFAGAMAVSATAHQTTPACALEPLELPLFGGTPVAVFATPDAGATPVSVSLPESQVEEVLGQYVACTNTGDPTLVWAMFTPRWYAEAFSDSGEHYLPAFEQMLDREGEPSGEPLELVEIVEVEPGDTGGTIVTATFRSGDQEWTDRLTLVPMDGQWLIDDVELLEPAP